MLMRNLKKIIRRYMQMITFFMVVAMVIIIVGIQMVAEQKRAYESATQTLYQMEQVLAENRKELTRVESEYRHTCLYNASAIAYMIEQDSSLLDAANIENLRKIAEFMEVDEIHIFDKTGRIFAGTNPEYYGLTMDDGEQIRFFKPLLNFKTLKLVQEIAPNTAEEKPMQYSALWSENKEFIVQVGMEPVRIMEETEKNELSYIFSLFRVDTEANYYAIDVESGEIVGATDMDSVGRNVTQMGINTEALKGKTKGFHARINGVHSYCVFEQVGSNYVGCVVSSSVLYGRILNTALIATICFILIAFMLVSAVTWYMNRYVVGGIYTINEKLHSIARGNLEETIDVQSSVEFSELSSYINDMVKSLLANNRKMSYVLSKTNMYIGVYEFNRYMKKVHFTEYIPRILCVDTEKLEEISSDYERFHAFIEKIRENPVPDQQGIFRINGEKEHYVRLEETGENGEIFGVAIDVTEEMDKFHQIEAERDIDLLTGLYNRRGMDTKLSLLFNEPEKLGYSALIMIDADGLKGINDTYGHEKGDVYLKKISQIINNFGMKESLAARQGGDEFVLFLYHYSGEEELLNTIRTLEYIQDHGTAYLGDDINVPLRFSLGYSMAGGGTDYEKLLKEADTKMYQNKRERKRKKSSY